MILTLAIYCVNQEEQSAYKLNALAITQMSETDIQRKNVPKHTEYTVLQNTLHQMNMILKDKCDTWWA